MSSSQSHSKSNLAKPRLKHHAFKPTRCLALALRNAYSVKGKVDDVSTLFQDHGLQILALNKTWHEGYDRSAIRRLCRMGFTVLEEARPRSSQVSKDSIHWSNHGDIAVVA